jgi:predicted aspartyl protease
MSRRFRHNLIIAAGLLGCPAAALAGDLPATTTAHGSAAAQSALPEAGRSADFRIIAGSDAVIPLAIEAGAVIVNVSVDGRGPFPLMFDTGAEDALTPETAAALGLRTEGSGTARDSGGDRVPITFTQAVAVRLGDAEMTDQPFAVLGLPSYVTDRGSRPPLAGFIGYELLARFAARLDYENKTLTLTPGPDFRYDGKGVRVPLAFIDKTPVVPAAADGTPGRFLIDTGSSGALTLRREFVDAHDLATRHPSAVRIKSVGAAGPFEAILMRLDRFDIADSRIERPATRFPSIRGQGLPFTDVDGSIGYEILRQFVITFDYRRRELWFEHSKAFGTKTGQGSAGFQAIKAEGAGFTVLTVVPNTAAADAGIRAGDLITEVDGQTTAPMSLSELAELMRRPVGTVVHLATVRDGMSGTVELTLKDILP